jgi:hypothetical protein
MIRQTLFNLTALVLLAVLALNAANIARSLRRIERLERDRLVGAGHLTKPPMTHRFQNFAPPDASNPSRPAALALVVWYLITPYRRVPLYPAHTFITQQGPPFAGWPRVASFPCREECQAHLDLATRCVASDDPRLYCPPGNIGCVVRLREFHHP